VSYAALRGRIREKYGTQEAFDQAMGKSVTTLSAKLNRKTDWTRAEIELAPGERRGFFRYDREGTPNCVICPRIDAAAYKQKLFALLGLG
jgi:hypothetical protein